MSEVLVKFPRKIELNFLSKIYTKEEDKEKISQSYILINEPSIEVILNAQSKPMDFINFLKDNVIEGKVWGGKKFIEINSENVNKLPISILFEMVNGIKNADFLVTPQS